MIKVEFGPKQIYIEIETNTPQVDAIFLNKALMNAYQVMKKDYNENDRFEARTLDFTKAVVFGFDAAISDMQG